MGDETPEGLRARIAELELERDRYYRMVDESPEAIIVFDRAGNILLFNKKAEEAAAFDRHQLIGKNIFETSLIDAEYSGKAMEAFARLAAGKEVYNQEIHFRNRHGVKNAAEMRGMPIGDRILVSIRNITARKDLFFRLNAFTIQLPPLCDRREDILPLAEHFLRVYRRDRGMAAGGFSPAAGRLLESYNYPGNARELKNLVERAAMLSQSEIIQPADLNLPSAGRPVSLAPAEDSEATRIQEALERNQWNRRKAAKELGLSYSSLRRRIQKYDLH